MNHETAAELRDELNRLNMVRGPDDDATGQPYELVTVHQPGYLNGRAHYEVRTTATDAPALAIYGDFLDLARDYDCYIRVRTDADHGYPVLHFRDWTAEGDG